MTKKEFALEQIKEYVLDPTRCGYNKEENQCMNLTPAGNMCVAGKNYLPEVRKEYTVDSFYAISRRYNNIQKDFMIPGSVDILSREEWGELQSIHDHIAKGMVDFIDWSVEYLLFTKEEMEALKQDPDYQEYLLLVPTWVEGEERTPITFTEWKGMKDNIPSIL